MGLLTDPSGGQGKYTKFLIQYYSQICLLLVISGFGWFCILAYPPMNASTYFSENALLPGLVKSQFREDRAALRYFDELADEMRNYDDSIPYSWLTAKFRQIGLDTYTHNFSLISPVEPRSKYHGKNVYGILRAARASSTEALVLSVPYRPHSSVHPSTAASVAIMLAFAKHANKEKYWAKDIIFLITEHEQLGAQAWLEAYYDVTCGSENVLDHGDLKGRAGAIQAAINLELHAPRIGQIDIKIEGLNGQLPNLDLFNLAAKMCIKEGIYHTFKNKAPEYHNDPLSEWFYYFKNILSMVFTQASGVPNGNHGLFHRFGIQALTLEGFETSGMRGTTKVGFLSVGRVIEGTFRSMNNLLEKFHQSFFFYLLPSTDRYISIGLYMPAVCLVVGAIIIRACAKWYKMQEKLMNGTLDHDLNYTTVVIIFVLMHAFGVLMMKIPTYAVKLSEMYGYDWETCIIRGLCAACGASLFFPMITPKRWLRECDMHVLNVFALLELGTAILCISMNNFSLGWFCVVVCIPAALVIHPASGTVVNTLQKICWLVVHPLLILFGVVFHFTSQMFAEDTVQKLFNKSAGATQQAIVYSVVDSMIYGNWLFSVVTGILMSNWMCFWFVSFANVKVRNSVVKTDKKTN